MPANPGVCGNCGENVFQCHKCRAINYDEKDPFLCNSCGFCKYAKFEYSLTARPCCAVDPIENEEDRKKALASINSLLEKADKVYRQLISNKPELEQLLVRVSDGSDLTEEATGGGSPVNKFIHQLGQKYCLECKNLFEDLSKIIQKVMATRLELISFDKSKTAGGDTEPGATPQLERKLSGVGVGGLIIRHGSGERVVELGNVLHRFRSSGSEVSKSEVISGIFRSSEKITSIFQGFARQDIIRTHVNKIGFYLFFSKFYFSHSSACKYVEEILVSLARIRRVSWINFIILQVGGNGTVSSII